MEKGFCEVGDGLWVGEMRRWIMEDGAEWNCKMLILESVSKKTTHRSSKKQGFHLWFFLPPFTQKIHIFRGFLAKMKSDIMVSQQGQQPKANNRITANSPNRFSLFSVSLFYNRIGVYAIVHNALKAYLYPN